MEKRTLTVKSADVKTRDEGEEPIIEGYFSVFDQEYQYYPWLTESVDRHAFDDQLDQDVRALIDHDTAKVLGRTRAGTLSLSVDDHGLYGKIRVNPRDTEAMNCYERVKRGDVSQCSFGFTVRSEEWRGRDDGTEHVTIKALDLYEVSVCTFPAYDSTNVSARSADITRIKKRNMDMYKKELLRRLKGDKHGT